MTTLLCALAPQNVKSEPYDAISDLFDPYMESKGYMVSYGKMVMHPAEECDDFARGLCSSDDPFHSFGTFEVPTVANEYVEDLDKNYEHRFHATEAVVFMCKTPSESDYFSYTPFLSKRVYLARSRAIHASLSDSLNPFTIKVERVDDSYEAAFGKNTVIIASASKGTKDTVVAALLQAGVSEDIMNFLDISSDVVDIGVSKDKDSIGFMHRVIGDVSDDYMMDPQCKITRLTPVMNSRTGVQAYKPLAAPYRAKKESGESEAYLSRTLNQLERFIKKSYYAKYQTVTANTVSQTKKPEKCLSKAKPCFGDNSDYTSYSNFPGLPMHTNTFFVLHGVNHVETGFATLQTISVSDMSGNSFGTINVGSELFNSASVYMSSEYDDKLFAIMIARNCEDIEYCMEVSADNLPLAAKYLPLKFSETLVLNPKTGTGPSEKEIEPFRVIYGERMQIGKILD